MESKNKTLFELHTYLDVEGLPNEIINKILEKISDLEDIGYAGYLEKKWLELTLKRLVLDKKGENQPFYYTEELNPKIKLICEEAINKCGSYIKDKVHIFLFPTFDKFTIEKMNGVSGFCPWDNTNLIFINFTNQGDKYLKETIVHELAHALSPYREADAPIGHWLILEGLAENFKDFIFPGSQSDWTKAISEIESQKILTEINPLIKENNFEKYSEIFFGTGKYPLWAGYTIGYLLVKRYLEKFPNSDWKELLRKNPEDILKEININ